MKLPETQRERKSEARSDPLDREKSGEHIWIAAPAASSCQLLSLAGGEESNGIYTSRQKSRRAPEVLVFLFSPNSINHLAGVSHKVWHNSVQVHVCVCVRKWVSNPSVKQTTPTFKSNEMWSHKHWSLQGERDVNQQPRSAHPSVGWVEKTICTAGRRHSETEALVWRAREVFYITGVKRLNLTAPTAVQIS